MWNETHKSGVDLVIDRVRKMQSQKKKKVGGWVGGGSGVCGPCMLITFLNRTSMLEWRYMARRLSS